ncbi:MAG: hypothetical protein HY901_18940 [Deltaproteobacteria bacterium]|nr:hypothetical protein [Deltaproteobacteria bacterium]
MSLTAVFAFSLLLSSAAPSPAAVTPAPATPSTPEPAVPDLPKLQKMMGRFASTPLKVDLSKLSAGDRKALVKLIEASRVLDVLFMKQLWDGNLATWEKVQQDTTPQGQARARYYWLNKGPWSILDDWSSFVPGTPARKPLGASFYPADATKQEIEEWIQSLPVDQDKSLTPSPRDQATGFFSVIRRGADKKLTLVPYSQEYAPELTRIAALLKEAAAATDNATLKRFLTTRAEALGSNDYFASDVAWMDLDAPLDVTFGPYETYNDELFGYKASFEAYVNLRDDAETKKLAAFSRHLQEIENALPIPQEHKNPKIGAQSPIRVVQQVFAAGDGAHGVKSAAYNLPNDERVITQKGSKRVMLKNVQEAKFNNVLVPISKKVLGAQEQSALSFDSFFTHILAHELTHGLGPHQIKVGGRATTPREELKDLYSAIEEAKADVLGLFALQHLMDHEKRLKLNGLIPVGEAAERRMYVTFLASTFRTLRFGIHEAHGKGMALQVNYLADKKAIVANPDGTWSVDLPKFKAGIKDLARELLMIEATGDRAAAQKMIDTLGVLRPETLKALSGLESIPTDIDPVFVTAEEVAPVARK